jgi:OOP family OmpA-OmpF porin
MRHISRWLILTTLALSLMPRNANAARFEEKRFSLTPFVGGTLFDSERRFQDGQEVPDDMYYGGRAGFRITHSFWLDLAGGATSVEKCCDWTEWNHFSANLMWSPATLRTFNPFLSLGGGVSNLKRQGTSSLNMGTFEAAGGLRMRLSEAFGLRLEARNVLAVPKKNWSKSHLDEIVLGAGLTFAFGGRDAAPEQPVVATVVRVDTDGDGVLDPLDRCPDTPRGCRVDADGCPIDSDHDGVCDGNDRCPDTRSGCAVDAGGCPLDADGDGVCDGIDQCPDTPAGTKVNATGCTEQDEIIHQRETELLDTGMLRISDINFDFDKSTIREDSHRTLDIVGKVLTKWPGLKIEIGAYTDSKGTAKYNLALSDRRAASVRSYLLDHFPQFKPDQLTSKGFGESDPQVANDTDAHRAQNRRVEFRVINKEVLKRDK